MVDGRWTMALYAHYVKDNGALRGGSPEGATHCVKDNGHGSMADVLHHL